MAGSSQSRLEMLITCSRCGVLHPPADGFALHPLCDLCRAGGGPADASNRAVRVLDERSVADAVTRTSPGSFVLGYLDGSTFTPFLVGRSDSDVGDRLRHWVDAPSCAPRRPPPCAPWSVRSPSLPSGGATAYTHFAFRYAHSAIEAFEQECRDYHNLGGGGGLDNPRHPQPPSDSPWACPLHA